MHFSQIFERQFLATKYINEILLPANEAGEPSPTTLPSKIFITVAVLQFLRSLPVSMAMRGNELFSGYLEWDRIILYVNQDHLIDATMLNLFSLQLLMFAYYDYVIYVRPDPFAWRIVYDFVHGNSRNFFRLNPQFAFPFKRLSIRVFVTRIKEILGSLREKEMKATFTAPHLTYFPKLPVRARVNVALRLWLLNTFNGLFLLFAISVLFTGYAYYGLQILPLESLLMCAFFTVTSLSAAYIFIFGFEKILFFFILYYLLAYTYTFISGHSNGQLVKAIRLNGGYAKKQTLREALLVREFTRFHREHLRLSNYVLRISKTVTSPGLLYGFLATIGSNIYAATTLNLRNDISSLNRFMLTVVILAQLSSGIIILLQYIQITNSLHAHHREIYRAQMSLGERFLSAKLKVSTFYEILNSNERICFKVGPIDQVSSKALFEFAFVYWGYVMFTVDLINN